MMATSMNPEEWDKIKATGVLKETERLKLSDWEKRYRKGSDTKYGTLMYSPTINKFRKVTFSEFYGGGLVD